MPLICNIRAAKLVTPYISSGRYSAISLFPRRLASFYNANIAGLTEEQIEVCQAGSLREDNTMLTTQ
jgi:hypothetical protein